MAFGLASAMLGKYDWTVKLDVDVAVVPERMRKAMLPKHCVMLFELAFGAHVHGLFVKQRRLAVDCSL